MSLKPGDKAPEIVLRDQQGKLCNSKNLRGKNLVLFFYPKDDTPGCTAEATSFRDNLDSFTRLNSVIWGVSGDDEESHKQFAQRNDLPFPLLSDKGNGLRKAFGVPKALGMIPGRVTFIIDSNGTIKHVFNNLLNGPAHVTEALRVLGEIKQKT